MDHLNDMENSKEGSSSVEDRKLYNSLRNQIKARLKFDYGLIKLLRVVLKRRFCCCCRRRRGGEDGDSGGPPD